MGRLVEADVETIAELITDEHMWNVEKIRSIFLAHDADAILKIRLRRRLGDEVLAWAKENRACTWFARLIELSF
jgi:hypothetical protein